MRQSCAIGTRCVFQVTPARCFEPFRIVLHLGIDGKYDGVEEMVWKERWASEVVAFNSV